MENVSGSAIYQYVCLLQNAQAIMQARKKIHRKVLNYKHTSVWNTIILLVLEASLHTVLM